jgi:N-carbamoylputrescine amidase
MRIRPSSPRATATATTDKWQSAGVVAAGRSGAFSLSSNRVEWVCPVQMARATIYLDPGDTRVAAERRPTASRGTEAGPEAGARCDLPV